jgi:hypothetical protein
MYKAIYLSKSFTHRRKYTLQQKFNNNSPFKKLEPIIIYKLYLYFQRVRC